MQTLVPTLSFPACLRLQASDIRAAIFDVLADMQATFTKLETLRIPVIAAIQGGCIGGAVDMVSACCIRYATHYLCWSKQRGYSHWRRHLFVEYGGCDGLYHRQPCHHNNLYGNGNGRE